MATKVPVIGPPPHWKWFPKWDPKLRHYAPSVPLTRQGLRLWWRHFESSPVTALPAVYWSPRFSVVVHARTYDWGIIISQRAYRHVEKTRRRSWLHRLLLHELLHWAGYAHDRRFREAAKKLGTW